MPNIRVHPICFYFMKKDLDSWARPYTDSNDLNTNYEGKGYASEAARALIDVLFTHKNARRIYAYVEDDNLRSQKLCKRLGMRKEGLFMEFISFVGNADGTPKYENTCLYALLKKEWQNIR